MSSFWQLTGVAGREEATDTTDNGGHVGCEEILCNSA